MAATEKRLKRPVEIKRPAPPRSSRVSRDKRAALARSQGAVSMADAAISFGAAGRVRPAGKPTGGAG